MTLTKATIIETIMLEYDLNKHDAKKIVELFFESIKTTLEKGEDVKLSGFGNFTVKEKSSRPGRNPKTGEEALISARSVVTFRPGMKFRQRVIEKQSK